MSAGPSSIRVPVDEGAGRGPAGPSLQVDEAFIHHAIPPACPTSDSAHTKTIRK
ncbi:hypothetical protein [Streptomyces koyangensis]|uniref:hypothetical protein n=1 Tax=Streptomyces koyangensis TaxID=188770 RepID=UPI003C2EA46C